MPFSLPISPTFSFIHFVVASSLVLAFCCTVIGFIRSKLSNTVYLIDFSCYVPPDALRVPKAKILEHFQLSGFFNRESIDFMERILERSGIGEEACMPPGLHQLPAHTTLNPAREEVEQVLFTLVKHLLSKHKVDPDSIDILICNCSLFCPTPSVTSMIINKFGFRNNVKSINLSGMGCSAGLLAISLVKELFKVHSNSMALVLSMEAVTPSGYRGQTKSMLVANTIFRMGGAAVLLSNKRQHKRIANYKLQHLVRTHMGFDEQSYSSVYQQSDEDGNVGVSLSRALLHVAGNGLRTNISELGPLVLPFFEQLRYLWSLICWKLRFIATGARQKETYVPKFKKAFKHFCIHAGGKAIVDAFKNNLKLEEEDGEASQMTLYRFGNTSSSSVWYELCYLEAKRKVKKGDLIWQISFGSGFKCNSAVWKSISDIHPDETNAWSDTIHLYPVKMANMP